MNVCDGTSRRGFLLGCSAFAAMCASGAEVGRRRLRVGLLSDIHVTTLRDVPWFEKALRYFDGQGVDAVLISGDLTRWSKYGELKRVADTWFRVFPGDRGADGRPVARLFVTGNHDIDGFAYDGARYKSIDEARPESLFFNRQKFWQELFHEDYREISVKEVKGYKFVLRHWLSILGEGGENFPLAKAAGLKRPANPYGAWLAKVDLPKDRPFFFVQHEPPNDTVNSTWLVRGRRWGSDHDDGTSTRFLSEYPNCVCFCGHTHFSLTDEMSIWQGKFTAVNCSALTGFPFTPPGRENGWNCDDFKRRRQFEMEPIDKGRVRQGMVMDVYDDMLVFHRREFVLDHQLGPDWVVPLGPDAARPHAIETRLKTAKAPVFPKGAKVSVKEAEGYSRDDAGTGRAAAKHPQIQVVFPAVRTMDGSPVRGWDYGVKCIEEIGEMSRIIAEKRVFSPNSLMSEVDDVEPVVCAFAKSEIPYARNARYRFEVTPYSCWGVGGHPIAVGL